jgi:hypothetical protein
MIVNSPNIVNSSNVVNCPNVVNGPNVVNCQNVVNDHNIVIVQICSFTLKYLYQAAKILVVDFGIVPKVWCFFLHFITTFGSLTTVGQFRTFCSFVLCYK